MEPIVSYVKPVVGFHIEPVQGGHFDRVVTEVIASESYINLFKVRFEGSDEWKDIIWLKRFDD